MDLLFAGIFIGVFLGIVLCMVAGWRAEKADPIKTVNNAAGLPLSFHEVAFAIKDAYDKMGGPNYLVIETAYNGEPFLLTIQRKDGETPYEQLTALRKAVAVGYLPVKEGTDGGEA